MPLHARLHFEADGELLELQGAATVPNDGGASGIGYFDVLGQGHGFAGSVPYHVAGFDVDIDVGGTVTQLGQLGETDSLVVVIEAGDHLGAEQTGSGGGHSGALNQGVQRSGFLGETKDGRVFARQFPLFDVVGVVLGGVWLEVDQFYVGSSSFDAVEQRQADHVLREFLLDDGVLLDAFVAVEGVVGSDDGLAGCFVTPTHAVLAFPVVAGQGDLVTGIQRNTAGIGLTNPCEGAQFVVAACQPSGIAEPP